MTINYQYDVSSGIIARSIKEVFHDQRVLDVISLVMYERIQQLAKKRDTAKSFSMVLSDDSRTSKGKGETNNAGDTL